MFQCKTAVLIAIVCLGILPISKAVSPPPDGGYAGGNTAEGTSALFSLTTGVQNTALGSQALFSNTSGSNNTATGWNALRFNKTANDNTATGSQALYKNTTGTGNTAVGRSALLLNTTSGLNTAVGFQALQANSEFENTAVGYQAGVHNTTGATMCAVGAFALFSNTTGTGNNAVGDIALFDNTTGSFNNAFGVNALGHSTGDANTAVGDGAGASLVTGNGNVYVGAAVVGVDGDNGTTRIKNIYATVQPVVGTDPDYVTVNSGNRLGRGSVSSRRYKHDIKPMEKASEGLFKLNPVRFRYKEEFDRTQTVAFGLIAEDVAEVYPELVGRNAEGQPESVRYEQINAMLLNEFLNEHRKVEQQDRQLHEQAATIARQQNDIDALKTGLQKVNDKLELNNARPRLVDSDR